jgi:hypothetical protein
MSWCVHRTERRFGIASRRRYSKTDEGLPILQSEELHDGQHVPMVYNDEHRACENGLITHFSGLSLLFCFVDLALRIQFASLGDRSLDHAKILTSFPEPSGITLDMERDWVNPSYTDFTASAG